MKPTVIALWLLCTPAWAKTITTTIDPEQPLANGRTVIWSPLFQANWEQMNATLGGKARRVVPPNLLMEKLDRFEWQPDQVMPDGSWKTWAGGATKTFIDTVNTEAAELTGEPGPHFKLMQPGADHLVLFGLLNREVEFTKAFFRSSRAPLGFQGKPVQFFGVKGDISEEFSHVKVLSYRPGRRSHAIEIPCKQGDDTVILYQPEHPQPIASACKWLRHWRKTHGSQVVQPNLWNAGHLRERDQVRIPYLDFNTSADLTDQLQGSRFHGHPGDPWVIVRAEQKTSFTLHERGAKVHVRTSMEIDPFADAPSPPISRHFIYNRPFFVFLWRANAEWPYLAAWIGDTTAMIPME